MSITLKVSDGRLRIMNDQHLVLEMAGGFLDALIDGNVIYAVIDNGRVQQYDLKGNFKKGIVSAKAVGIRLIGDVLDVTKADGRHEHFKAGKSFQSSAQAFKPKTQSAKAAEDLGAQAADWLIKQIGAGLRALVRLIRRKLNK